MHPRLLLPGIIFAGLMGLDAARAQDVVVDTAAELVDAINGSADVIEVEGLIEFDAPYQGGDNALPVIRRGGIVIRGRAGAEFRASGAGFRLLRVNEDGGLALQNLVVRGFTTPGGGGAVEVDGGGLTVEGVHFIDNQAGLGGGALQVKGPTAELVVSDSLFEGNSAGHRGGAVNLREAAGTLAFERNRFRDNQARLGCAVSLRNSKDARFYDNVFRGGCGDALVNARLGGQRFAFHRNTWAVSEGLAYRYRISEADGFSPSRFSRNLLVRTGGSGVLCRAHVEGSAEDGGIRSDGWNLANRGGCELTADSDRVVSADTRILADTEPPAPVEGGPAMDALPLETIGSDASEGRCGVSDARGLGRPQDGDGDGVAACDIGAVEARRGPDIGPAQTGAYFDPARPGEGYFVEVLEDGRAWVTMFTYTAIGGFPAILDRHPTWFFGLGRVEGNSIVVPRFIQGTGVDIGTPPPGYEPLARAAVSLVFQGCETGAASPGTAYFRGEGPPVTDVPSFTDLFTPIVRLSSVVPCGEAEPHPRAGLSGNFYDPQRAGEGIQVQWLPDGRVVVVWYLVSEEGRAVWMISDGATVDGDTVTAPMLFPAEATAFGPDFDPAEIGLETAGTLTLGYEGCDEIALEFEADLAEFEDRSQIYQRLTRPAGTNCPE